MTNTPETFSLYLGNGTRCTARVDMAALRDSMSPAKAVAFDLQGPRTAKDWPKYHAWAKAVWQSVADAANKSILSIFTPPHGRPFAIVFEPNRQPQTVPLP